MPRAWCPTWTRWASATATASPYLQARPGSTHGYDIVDHNAINPEIGSEADFERFVRGAARARHGPDPRHGAQPHGRDGRRQRLVAGRAGERPGLALRRASSTSTGSRSSAELRGKVLLPVLGDHYGAVLERGELELAFDADARRLQRALLRAPLSRRSARVPAHPARCAATSCGAAGRAIRRWQEFGALITAFGHLPARDETDRGTRRRAQPRQGGAQAPAWPPVRGRAGDRAA